MTDSYVDPGTPDCRSALRYLWWLITSQRRRIAAGALLGSVWMVCLTLPPYLLSRAIDDGLEPGQWSALVGWVAALLGVGVLNAWLAIMRHRTMTRVRMDAAFRSVAVVVRQATVLGGALPRRVTAGEIVTIGFRDVAVISGTLTITGPGVGAVLAYVVVAALLLTVSPLLAVVVLLGVPLLAVLVGPLLWRLQGVESAYREQQGGLAARFEDIVGGLRVLNGIGGKEAYAERYRRGSRELQAQGYHVGGVTSWIQALGVGLPTLFLGVVTWLAARMATQGAITVGELVAVYGYTAVLVVPVSFFIEGGYDISRGLVAARRVIRFLAMEPDSAGGEATSQGPAAPSTLRDPESGVEVVPGGLIALVSARPSDSAAVVDRLGRFVESAATWGGIRLDEIDLTRVRSADPGRGQRGRSVRRTAARGDLRRAGPGRGGHRPRRPRGHGAGHRPRSAGRTRLAGRRAGPQPLRRTAAARPAGPGPAGRSRDTPGGRAHLGGRRTHRGGRRGPAARRTVRPHDGRHQHVTAPAGPGGHRVLPGRRLRRGRRQPS